MLEELREEVCRCNLMLPRNGLVKMTSGNVSGRDPETDLVVIKPSGVDYEKLSPAGMIVVDPEGNVIEGDMRPSIDTETHLYIYRSRPDVNGVCHTHSTFASSFAALGRPIPACLTASAMFGGEVPLGGYVPIGGRAIGEEIVNSIGESLAIIMQNHGVFTIGRSASVAAKMAVEVEEVAKITHLAMLLGDPVLLEDSQIAEIAHMYTDLYGQR